MIAQTTNNVPVSGFFSGSCMFVVKLIPLWVRGSAYNKLDIKFCATAPC